MRPNSDRHHRRSIRLKGYDYAQVGVYFVTICTQGRECLFGEVIGDEPRLNALGTIVNTCWCEIPRHFPDVELDAFVIMPNHIHGILVLSEAPPSQAAPSPESRLAEQRSPQGPKPRSVGAIVGSFKSAAARRINECRRTRAPWVWQRNYYEHIVRNETALNDIRSYIEANPARWALDQENPANAVAGVVVYDETKRVQFEVT